MFSSYMITRPKQRTKRGDFNERLRQKILGIHSSTVFALLNTPISKIT